LKEDFLNILERLTQHQVDFVLVGGLAGIVHGCSYVTQDIDICCEFSVSNLLRIQKAISDLHPVHRMTPKKMPLELTEESSRNLKNLYLDTDIGTLDCLGFIDGVGDFTAVCKSAITYQVEDILLRILSLDGLIKAKQAMNRPRDQEMIIQLETIKKQIETKKNDSNP